MMYCLKKHKKGFKNQENLTCFVLFFCKPPIIKEIVIFKGKLFDTPEPVMRALISMIDTDHDGKINFEEFIKLALHR